MTTAKKITEAENILNRLKVCSTKEFEAELNNFVHSIHDIFSHLLDEYNKKFDLKIDRIGLEKFKVRAKKMGRIDAINFLIWYEKEYRKIKDDEICGYLLERKDNLDVDFSNMNNVITASSLLLNRAKTLAYSAYERF
jgi:hypothetical protein